MSPHSFNLTWSSVDTVYLFPKRDMLDLGIEYDGSNLSIPIHWSGQLVHDAVRDVPEKRIQSCKRLNNYNLW